MAMVVKNNMAAVRTLNTLNSNSSALQKSLAKVSSGMKINSAQDDASGYAISERMRVQIRALDQANQNTQNGSSLMKTAEGAVASTIEILKTMKEKAINAATDTNTDDDRATIQKEINQFVDQIDDNALVTFNGKYLVEGSKVQSGEATYTALTNQSLAKGTTGDTALTALQNRKDEALGILSTDRITASYVKDGRTYATTFTASDTTLKGIFQKLEDIDTTSQIFADSSNKSVQAADPSLATSSADTSTGTTSGGYDEETLTTAKEDLAAQMEALRTQLDTLNGELGQIGQGAVIYGEHASASGGKGYTFNSDVSVSGAAYDLAKLLVEAANLGDLTNTTALGETAIKTANNGDDNTGKFAVTLVGTKTSNPGVGDTFVNAGTTTIGSAYGNAPLINLMGLNFGGNNMELEHTTDTANVTATQGWDGTSNINSDTLKAVITNVVARLNNTTNIDAANTDTCQALATQISETYVAYTTALDAVTEKQKEITALQSKIDLVDTAITAITAKDEADALEDGMTEAILSQLNIMAHGGDEKSNNVSNSILDNNQYIQYKLLGSNAVSAGNATLGDAGFTSQYKDDESTTMETIAQELKDAIVDNIKYYVTGDAANSAAKTTAATAMRAILNSVGVSTANADATDYVISDWTTSARKGVFKATDYNTAYGSDAANNPRLTAADSNNWGGTAADINGWAAKYDEYKQAEFTVTQKKSDLDAIMAGYASGGDTSDGPALLNGNAIGLNTSGEIVKTADETDGITITANGEGLAGQIAGVTISVADAVGNAKKSVNASLNAFKTTIFAANESKEDTSLKLHVGGAANQSLSVGLMDMRSQALGLKGADGSVISVTTQDNANAAIAAFDNALSKALDQATTIGAIEARLEYTSSNLTTSSENVQAAESTIRDADMAKEMTTYTKNNVLLQAAQSMLAQANQNASAVLSLLQ